MYISDEEGGVDMARGITRAEQNLFLLESLIPKDERLYIWCFSNRGDCIGSSCPEPIQSILISAMKAFGVLDKALAWLNQTPMKGPCILGTFIGMQWAITWETERSGNLFFLIGPVFYAIPDKGNIEKNMHEQNVSVIHQAPGQSFSGILDQIAVLPYAVFIRYVLMIHNTLTGQQMGLEDLSHQDDSESSLPLRAAGDRNRMKVYQAEKALMNMVRTGNINYQAAFKQSIAVSPGVPVHGRDPLRHAKTSIIVFTSLVCRAAMEGGLSPEVAYALGDSYIQTIEDCRDSGELSSLAHAMYHDFIFRVHYANANPNFSHAIQKCCDYIELRLDHKIRVSDLASLVGYTDYYLAKKFKQETGKSISTYIRDAKIARAQVILETTNIPIVEIADQLAFNTPNYFIKCFRETVGCTPSQYRKRLPGKR